MARYCIFTVLGTVPMCLLWIILVSATKKVLAFIHSRVTVFPVTLRDKWNRKLMHNHREGTIEVS
jgi:hypothetical protein